MSLVDFRSEFARLLELRDWNLPQLARTAGYSSSFLCEVRKGRKNPSRRTVQDLDAALQANGYLITLFDRGHAVPAHERPTTALEQVAAAAAHESTTQAARIGAHQISGTSLEQVQDDVEHLTREFATMTPLDALLEARRVRDMAVGLSERTRKPGQVRDLYLAAALACCLLSVASFDLASWHAADEQARAAYVYGELIDHRSLQSWARGQQALIAYWSGRSGTRRPAATTQVKAAQVKAAHFAHAGLELAPPGTPRARLLSITARAWACAGAADQAIELLHSAERERDLIGESGNDDLHDKLGGQFGWGPARQAMCSASAWLGLGDAAQAVRQATRALDVSTIDTTGTQVALKAAADLATAHLAQGSLDAAGDALRSVWQVEPAHRRHALTSRLEDVAARLTHRSYRGAAEARALREQIEEFNSACALKELGPGPTRPADGLPSAL